MTGRRMISYKYKTSRRTRKVLYLSSLVASLGNGLCGRTKQLLSEGLGTDDALAIDTLSRLDSDRGDVLMGELLAMRTR